MPARIPAKTPQDGMMKVLARLYAAGHTIDRVTFPLIVVGVRGYYRDSMGVVGVNDRGIYDDALFVLSPNVFASFNANTDPAVSRRAIATLQPGTYYAHRIGTHKGYRALSQWQGEVTVARDGETALDTGYFGINIHRGGAKSTSSEGCQTIPPKQWPGFIALIESEARRLYGKDWLKRTVPYVLLA